MLLPRDAKLPLSLVGWCRPWLLASVMGSLFGAVLLSVEGSEPGRIYEELLARSAAGDAPFVEGVNVDATSGAASPYDSEDTVATNPPVPVSSVP